MPSIDMSVPTDNNRSGKGLLETENFISKLIKKIVNRPDIMDKDYKR